MIKTYKLNAESIFMQIKLFGLKNNLIIESKISSFSPNFQKPAQNHTFKEVVATHSNQKVIKGYWL